MILTVIYVYVVYLYTKHFTRIMFPGSVNPELAVHFSRHPCLKTYF